MSLTLYKHRHNKDVAIEILKKFYVKEKDLYKFKVRWWNIGECHEPFCMSIVENFKIPRKVWRQDWALYSFETK